MMHCEGVEAGGGDRTLTSSPLPLPILLDLNAEHSVLSLEEPSHSG